MEKHSIFEDFDKKDTYERSLERARNEKTRNFVVEFGKLEAQIAFDLNTDQVEELLDQPTTEAERARPPVRWM